MDYLSGGRRSPIPKVSTLGLKVIFFGLLSGAMIYADGKSPYLAGFRDTASWVLYPLERVIAFPKDVSDLFEHFHTRETLLEENRELKTQNLELGANASRLQALEAETARMRELLQAATSIGQKVRIVEVLSIAQDPYKQQLVINKG